MEADIGESLERIGEGIGEAGASVDGSDAQKRERRLAQMRELVKGLESLERRMQRGGTRGGEARAGDPRSGWGVADSQTWMHRNLNPAEIDAFRRAYSEQREIFDRIAGVLTAEEHGAQDISRLVQEMRAFEQSEAFSDPQRAIERQRQLIARLKELELLLKREEDEKRTGALPLPGNDSVSPAYRAEVEEYFRSLSRTDTSRRVAD